ncbi:MAG: hypothetical protein ACH37Z_18805 [Anaerolineae bacterium]
MDTNPGYAYRVGLYEVTIAEGAKYETPVFPLASYGRIVGTLRADKVCAVQVFQGPTETAYSDASESWSSTGNADIGAGDLFSHLVRVPEGYGRLWITNSGVGSATVRLTLGLTRAS